eukprot:g8750.t1
MEIKLPKGFRKVRGLGEGGQASVFLAEDHRTTSGENASPTLVAIKCYSRRLLIDERKQKRVRREIRNLRLLDHPHIIGFREALLSETHLCLVLNYASGGALFDVLCARERLDERHARWFFQQLILAVDYAHARGITNRDVKPENILLQPLADDRPPFALLCDFGLSRFENSGAISRMEGTFGYVAPELYIGKCRNVEEAKRAEVYSCGVCLYQMLFGLTKWPTGNSADANNKQDGDFGNKIANLMDSAMKEFEFPNERRLSGDCANFLKRLLQPNPENRITMAEIWGDSWFKTDLPPNAARLNPDLLARQKARDQERGQQDEQDILKLIQKGARKRHGRLYRFGKMLVKSVKKKSKNDSSHVETANS